jgi:hypothetical protein
MIEVPLQSTSINFSDIRGTTSIPRTREGRTSKGEGKVQYPLPSREREKYKGRGKIIVRYSLPHEGRVKIVYNVSNV